jgi:hypothetical protein
MAAMGALFFHHRAVTRSRPLLIACLLVVASAALADEPAPAAPPPPDLVKQANAPIASILQVRLQDALTPQFAGADGWGNVLSLAVTMPLRKYRLLPLPQLSLLTIPFAVTAPQGPTHFGDVRFLDIALLDVGHEVLFGIGPSFVFPTARHPTAGQGKWQAGPAAAIAFAPRNWLVGVLAQNPMSFAGGRGRAGASALFVQPFVTYQIGEGWFVRSQPQLSFDWKSSKQYLPLDLGFGRVFNVNEQPVSCFVEVTRNLSRDQPAPRYAVTVGVSLLFPNLTR